MPLLAALPLTRHAYITRPSPALPSRQTLPLFCQHRVLLLSMLLLIGLAGCGPASSDTQPNLGPRASTGGALLSKQGSLPSSTSGMWAISRGDTSQGDRPQSQPIGTPNSKTDAPSLPPPPPILDIPDSVLTDLASPDVGIRLRALDHWNANKPTASLDPVFEAMEDEDEAVREKATVIVEQRFAAAQERERD